MFEKELKDYLKAKDILRTKIINWLDTINDRFVDEDCCVCIEIPDYEHNEYIIEEIKDGKMITSDGDELDYRDYDVEVLLDLQGEILNYYSDVNYR